MPHIVVEYSRAHHTRRRIAELLQALHRAAASTGVVKADDLKLRAAPYREYLVAGREDSFCHVSIHLLAGRTQAQRVAVSESLRAAMVELLPTTTSLSVDVQEMDAAAYKKRLLR